MEYNEEVETLKKTRTEMKMELKNSISLLENAKKSLTMIINQAEDKKLGLEHKLKELKQKIQEIWFLKHRGMQPKESVMYYV